MQFIHSNKKYIERTMYPINPYMNTHGLSITPGAKINLDAGNINSYPGSGKAWNDLSGNNNNAISESNLIKDMLGIKFKVYALFPQNSINTNANFTIECWFKLSSINNIQTIISQGISTGNGHLQIRLNNGIIELVKSGVAYMGSFSGFIASPNTIYNLILTFDKVLNNYKLYINGSYTSNLISSYTFRTDYQSLADNFGYSGEFFFGTMYSFNYYDRILNNQEIQVNGNALKSRFL